MSDYTTIQGSFRVTANATIRLTDDPGGSPTTSDWVVTEGTVYDSIEDLLDEWGAQVVSDIAGYVIGPRRSATSYGRVTISSVAAGGNTFDVDWSQAGDGTDLRDWLGFTGNLSGEGPSYTTTNRIPAWFSAKTTAVTHDAPRLRRAGSTRARSRVDALDGSTWNQSNPDVSSADDVDIDLTIRFGHDSDPSESLKMIGELEDTLLALWDEDGCIPGRFSVYDGDSNHWVCRFGVDPTFALNRVPNSRVLWETTFDAVVESAAW